MIAAVPLVSVVIPHHNDSDTLAAALNSALGQSVSNLEVILVDDASTENIDGVVAGIGDGRLRIIRHDRNRGAAAARNTGIAAARGEFIAFLDADDSWYPAKLERQLSAIGNGEGAHCASCCAFLLLRPDGRWELHTPQTHDDWYRYLLWGCDLSPGSTLLVRRAAFDEIGPFDEGLRRLEDWDWLLRFALRFTLAPVAEPLARIRPGSPPDSKSAAVALERFAEKNLPIAEARGPASRRQLLAALRLERSALSYREGQYVRAAAILLWSLLLYPHRNREFYARMFHQLGRVGRGAIHRIATLTKRGDASTEAR
jgi:glycosyltransferase involved in cell wall biosynthesis